MAEKINLVENASREVQYKNLLPQIKALIESEADIIANMANVSAALKEALSFLWVGFYIVKENNQLVLGPFQGRVACTRIGYTAWKEAKTIIVPDVNKFPGHITCDSHSQSEIVIPVKKQNQIIAVLDIDSEILNNFTETDAMFLEQIAELI